MNIRGFICVFEKFKKIATLFQLIAVVQGLAIMTIQFTGPANNTAVTIMQYQDK